MKPHNTTAFVHTAAYYDLIYNYRNIQSQSRTITRLLQHYLPGKKTLSVLDVGCGTGAQAMELARAGLQVTGLDRSGEMINIARQKAQLLGLSIQFIEQDITRWTPRITYDAVISLFDVASYMTTNTMVDAYFQNISRALKPQGVCIFDAWWGPSVLTQKLLTTKRRYKTTEGTLERTKSARIDVISNTVSVTHALVMRSIDGIKTFPKEVHTMRYYFYPEIEYITRKWGLKLFSWGSLTYPIKPLPKESWSAAFLLRKVF